MKIAALFIVVSAWVWTDIALARSIKNITALTKPVRNDRLDLSIGVILVVMCPIIVAAMVLLCRG